MAKRLYVGGLPYSTTEDALKTEFSKIGPVASASVITDKFSGRSKGFGFIEYENDADADKAIESLNGKEFEGRTLTVNEARPMSERAPRRTFSHGGGGGSGSGGGRDFGNRRDRW